MVDWTYLQHIPVYTNPPLMTNVLELFRQSFQIICKSMRNFNKLSNCPENYTKTRFEASSLFSMCTDNVCTLYISKRLNINGLSNLNDNAKMIYTLK